MKFDTEGMTGELAWELSTWCRETADTLRDLCRSSDRTARRWWENEIDRPEPLAAELGPREDMLSFADRLQAEGYKWAEEAGGLFAEADGPLLAEQWVIDATIRVTSFTPADAYDGPRYSRHSEAIALHFDFDRELIDVLKGVLHHVRWTKICRGQPLGRMPVAGGWSKASRSWWVLSGYWEDVRQTLLDKGVTLTGPLANPRTVRDGFFERLQVWDVKQCKWR